MAGAPVDNSEAYEKGYRVGLRADGADGAKGENPYSPVRQYQEHRDWVRGWIDGTERFIEERKRMRSARNAWPGGNL